MHTRQIRLTLAGAILFTCVTLASLITGWIPNGGLQPGAWQKLFTTLDAGFAFLLWDYFSLLRSAGQEHVERRPRSYLIPGIVGFIFLAAINLEPIYFAKETGEALSNILAVIGFSFLLVSAFLRFSNQQKKSRLWELLWLVGFSALLFLLSRGLFTFLLLCLTSLYAGRGLLGLLGIPELNKQSLAPFMTLMFWSILLGIFVGIGVPVKYLSLVLWPLTIWLIWRGMKNKAFEISFKPGDFILVAIPLLLVFQYTIYGFFLFPGPLNMDHWGYIATGEYLWQFSRCVQRVNSPLYAYVQGMACSARYISSSFLSLFSGLLNRVGDTQPSPGVFMPWVLFVYCASLRFLSEEITNKKLIRTAYVLFGTLAGWLMMLVIASNFDNLLVISYFPMTYAIALKTDFSWRWNIFLGALFASLVYTYPEMAPFIILGAGFFILKRLLALKITRQAFFTVSMTIAASALAVLLPYLSNAVAFVIVQINISNRPSQLLPGAGFWPELVDPLFRWIALWGMGGGVVSLGFYLIRGVLAILLFALLAYGCILLVKTKAWDLLASLIVFVAAVIYFDFYRNYAYGTYKIIILYWWLVAYIVVMAFENLLERTRRFRKTLRNAGIAGYFAYFLCIAVLSMNMPVLPYNSIEPFKELENLPIPAGKSLALATTDMYNGIWAAYYLRKENVLMDPMKGYLVDVDLASPLVKQPGLGDIQYLLVDSVANDSLPGKPVWSNSRFSLTQLPEKWAYAVDIQAQNGVQFVNGKRFFWLGADPVKIRILSDFDGCGRVTLSTGFGPSLPEVSIRHLVLSDDHQTTPITVTSNTTDFTTQLDKGPNNIIALQVLDKPSLLTQPDGDGRIMLLGVYDLSVQECK